MLFQRSMQGELNPLRNFVDEKIDQYCLDHSTLPSDACEAIIRYTEEKVPKAYMVSGAQVGSLLAFMTQAVNAKRVLEIGCYTGYSALAVAEVMQDSGEVITLDVDPKTNAIARELWDRTTHGKKIRSVVAPALETLKTLRGPFDLIFIDADKPNYINYLKSSLELLSAHGVILADNCFYLGQVLQETPAEANGQAIKAFNDYVRSRSDLVSTLLPVRDGIHMITRRK